MSLSPICAPTNLFMTRVDTMRATSVAAVKLRVQAFTPSRSLPVCSNLNTYRSL